VRVGPCRLARTREIGESDLLRAVTVTIDGELFRLPNQGAAQDLRRFDFVKNVARLEAMLRDGAAVEGYAIAVANDPFYWQSGDYSWFIDAAFGIAELSKIEGVLAWAAHAGAGTQGAGRADHPPRLIRDRLARLSLAARRLHKRLHTHRMFDSEHVELSEKAPISGALVEPSDGLEPPTPSL
jgi:hypothetical protein